MCFHLPEHGDRAGLRNVVLSLRVGKTDKVDSKAATCSVAETRLGNPGFVI